MSKNTDRIDAIREGFIGSQISEREYALPSLKIQLLGSFSVWVDGQRVEECQWARQKPKLILKLLALQSGYNLHREQLAETLWPDGDPVDTSKNLHRAVHIARRALEPRLKSGSNSRFIQTGGHMVTLQSPAGLWVDVQEFECLARQALEGEEIARIEEALHLYSGDLLPEDQYEEWSVKRREQLRTLRHDLLKSVARLYEREGQPKKSIIWWRELVADDPVEESAHRQLMRLYAETGNRCQALRQYHSCCNILRDELDVRPETATTDLFNRITSENVLPLMLDDQPSIDSPAEIEDHPATAAESDAEIASPRFVTSEPVISSLKSRSGFWQFAYAALALVFIAATVAAVSHLKGRSDTVSSLAVLPLINESSDPNLEYLSDGITESLISDLSQLPRLRVMAPSTVSRYKGTSTDPLIIGRELKVRAVLIGRMTQQGDHLMVKMEFVDVEDGAQIWGGQFNHKLSGILAMQQEIVRELSDKLQIQPKGAEQKKQTRRYTENAEAYHLYLKGRFFWNKRSEEGHKKAIEYFNQAIEQDSTCALAYAGLADSYILLGNKPLAKAAAIKALAIDETLAEAHASLAFALMCSDWDLAGAEREFRRSIELNPSYATAHHWFAYNLSAMGRLDEAITEIRHAQELDPLSLIISNDVGEILSLSRKHEEAITAHRKVLEMDSGFIQAYISLGTAYLHAGASDSAIAEFQKAAELCPDNFHIRAFLGQAYAAAGRRKEALEILSGFKKQNTQSRIPPYHIAAIHTGLGEKDKAFGWLEKAYNERAFLMLLLKVSPGMDNLRTDPRLADLIQRVGLNAVQ